MEKIAVIVAGGAGTRMGSNLPKQFLLIDNKPVLYYTINTFLKAYADMQVILVVPETYTDMAQEIIDAYFDKERVRITIGGVTRFDSVKNGLKLIENEAIIFVHDAVRCLISEELIQHCFDCALTTGSAVPAVPVNDSIRLLTESGSEVMDRNKVVMIQTPQTFHSKILLPAFEIDYKEKFTDEATVVEAYGIKVTLIEGERTNLKITHPNDLFMAAAFLNQSAV